MEIMRSGTVQGAAEKHIYTSAGLCCLSQSLSAASMRVCQPLPVDLKASITSGEQRMVIRVLGLSEEGRPRRALMIFDSGMSLTSLFSRSIVSGSSATALRIFVSSSSVGKMVPGLSFGIFSHLLFSCEAQADNSTGCEVIGFGKTDREYSVTEISDTVSEANVSCLSVITSVILENDHALPVQIFGVSEREPVFLQIALAFLWVKSYFHEFIVCTLINKSNIDSLSSGRYSVPAAAKSVAGCENPEFTRAHDRACAVFLCVKHSHIRIMVGRAGQLSGWPGSLVTGILTPVRLTTCQTVRSLGGELLKLTREAATMATVPTPEQPEITLVNGRAVTTSLAVAAYFTKRHADVIRKIEFIECSPEFTERNFALSEHFDTTGRKLPCYQITRDGFAFLAMSFTGKRAALFKETYITAFNAMEQALIQRSRKTVSGLESIHNHAQRLHENLSILMAIWADNVQPLNPPIVVSGTVMDACHRSGLIAAGIARAMRRASK